MRWITIFSLAAFASLPFVNQAWTSAAVTDLSPPQSRAAANGPSEFETLSPEAGATVAGLQDTLEKGLRARLPADTAFIAKVVAMVRNDELPYTLVIGSFNWVRKNRSHKKYLMPYFKQVLRSRAAQVGIVIL